MGKNRVLIIDGTNLIYRNHYVYQRRRTTSGIYTGALYGTIRSLGSYLRKYKPRQMFICFDKGGKTFRHEIYPEYKAERKKIDIKLKKQFRLFRKFCEIINVPFVEMGFVEADDLIASLSGKAKDYNISPYIISGDKDLFQLINENTKVIHLSNKGHILYDGEKIRKKYGINPEQLLDYKALVGDSSDNIPGVPSIGDKAAREMLKEYSSLDNIYKNIENLAGNRKEHMKEHKEFVYLYKEVLTLKDGLNLDYDKYFLDYINDGYNFRSKELINFLSELELD